MRDSLARFAYVVTLPFVVAVLWVLGAWVKDLDIRLKSLEAQQEQENAESYEANAEEEKEGN